MTTDDRQGDQDGGAVDVRDRLGRGLRDLRVSVTDRCSFRCTYCMPREIFGPDHAFLDRQELLSFEEITRIVAAAAGHGVNKIRLTGGEPLLRRGLVDLVAMIDAVDGIDDIAMTTNGVLLPEHLDALLEAGLDRVTISLDALDDAVHKRMADTKVGVDVVLRAVDVAVASGIPVKVNTVVQRGVNTDQIVPLASWARDVGVEIRYIEFMDVGSTNGWERRDVVSAEEILAAIAAVHPLTALGGRGSQVASSYAYDDGRGRVGVIASVSQPFCRTCVRARLSAVGELFTCLFATKGHDLRALLRGDDDTPGSDDAGLSAALAAIWGRRTDRYSELRGESPPRPDDRVEMSYIGG